MSEAFNPAQYGETAQKVIDNFIGYWIDGIKIIFGDDAKPTDKAPIPFMASGSGYYMTYNDGIVSNTDPANRSWSYARVNWQVSNEHTQLHTTGVTMPYHLQEWADAVISYWGNQPIEVVPNYEYIEQYDVTSYKYKFTYDSANPTHIIGMNSQNQGDFDNYSNITWKKFDGTTYQTSTRIYIQNDAGFVDPNYQTHGTILQPITNYQLVLPMSSDAYWFYCGRPSGASDLQTNFYNTFNTHNTSNNYYDNSTYNDYYNTYNVSVNPDLNFDIGVGPLGVFIGVGGVGVAPVNINPEIDFDDLIDILTPIVNDLNNNDAYGADFDIELHDFDYYLSKYEDQGSFYISPIHQLDPLPAAPDIADTVIDVSEPLGILSTGFGALLDSFNNIGVTLTLTFTFLSCLVINKLRGD